MTIRVNRSVSDLKDLSESSDLAGVIKSQNDIIILLNFVLKNMAFQSNFNGYIATVKILASSTLQIQHFLGVTPKFRVILRQEGNGLITDVPTGWNTDIITLKNNGSEDVTLSVLIARE